MQTLQVGEEDRGRTSEQIRSQYEIECELANRLRRATRIERRLLYSTLYDEFYQRVPDHPQLTEKEEPERAATKVRGEIQRLRRYLSEDIAFLEIGSGSCALSFEVAQYVRNVVAIDVSDEVTRAAHTPENFELVLSDGCSIPLAENTFDVAYSNQLMEHLHPDDAFEQLQDIYKALVPGGIYMCSTPNRLSGPHDISKYFDTVATGFHLNEYTNIELVRLFKQVGFKQVRVHIGTQEHFTLCPLGATWLAETLFQLVPRSIRKRARGMPLAGILVIGRK